MSITQKNPKRSPQLDPQNENEGLPAFTANIPDAPEESSGDEDIPFHRDYSLTTPSTALPPLPEDAELQDFSGPAIHVTAEPGTEADSIASVTTQLHSASFDSLSPDSLSPIIPSDTLSPTAPSSPNISRRRSSSAVSRRPGSGSGSTGLAIPPSPRQRRRSSIISNGSRNEFNDFQDGDMDGSDFGDFDDFEPAEFESGDDLDEESSGELPRSSMMSNPLPDINKLEELRQYTTRAVDALFDVDHATVPNGSDVSEDVVADDASSKDDIIGEESEEEDSPFMLTDRAVSLWKQLTAPPPLQPPDWKRSRIRRLFLVSLGIPVDLDEILPKMTHKKLVLPSTRKRDKRSAEERRSRRNIPPPPEFEISGARQLCSMTESALLNMSDRDLQIHVSTLQAHTAAASGLLTYWLEQRDTAQSEKETFEQVVQNLVTYHKKQKDEQREASSNSKKKTRSRFSMRG